MKYLRKFNECYKGDVFYFLEGAIDVAFKNFKLDEVIDNIFSVSIKVSGKK